MPSTEKLDTHHKALTLNLDTSTFGSFAEIGAGQEVARWFLVVGGASGTVAKTISAYDKEVSDDLYGSGSRYVSRERLEAMLDHEWTELLSQLAETRGPQTRFFSFVDTVSARNFAGTNDPHGWIGLRFQLQPGGPPHDVLLHINMLDPSNVLQQEAIGILGVNLIYTAFYALQTKESFLEGLAQDVVEERIEIDYVDLRGPAFERWDRRTLLAHLVSAGLSDAVFSPSKGPTVPPTEALYKKAVVLAPGYFGHVDPDHTQVHTRLLASAIQELRNARWLFLPDSCFVHAERTGSGDPRLASSHRCPSRLWRRRAAFSPTRALPYDGSRESLHKSTSAFRRRSFPDHSSV
ncbi:MAG TPA: hypothetical protein VOA64_20085 [Candidatus Dormibacteraeota bacterium]|nr:hypothetical protein [Candidatus Dormibacteraeota bacterium]